MTNLIVAAFKDGTIAIDNELPWKSKEDMAFFKRKTTGQIVIMGRTTFETLGSKPLPKRLNIVISTTLKQEDFSKYDYLHIADSIESALLKAEELTVNDNNVWIIGGKQIYENTTILESVDSLYITEINETYTGSASTKIDLDNRTGIRNKFSRMTTLGIINKDDNNSHAAVIRRFERAKRNKAENLLDALDITTYKMSLNNPAFKIERFESYQRDIMRQLFESYADEKHSILVAPTGSGKSLIALLYSYCINIVDNKKTAILASDTFLQNQYVQSNDFFTKNLPGNVFSMLKGKGKYTCNQVFEPYPKGICADRNISVHKAAEKMQCAATCDYVNAYFDTVEATAKVLNYHLFMSYANYIGSHDITRAGAYVFDECHKIDDILDSFANITFKTSILEQFEFAGEAVAMYEMSLYDRYNEFIKKSKLLLIDLITKCISGGSYNVLLDAYVDFLSYVKFEFDNDLNDILKTSIKLQNDYAEAKEVPASVQLMIDVTKLYDRFAFYLVEAENTEPRHFVLTYDKDNMSLTASNISTPARSERFLLRHLSGPAVYMSATVGNSKWFAEHMGLKEDEYNIIELPSLFNFDKSPIVAVHPLISMSNRNRDANLESMIIRVDSIVDSHSTHNGVIHCGNKFIANFIMNNSKHKDRLITYTNASEKAEILAQLTSNTNKVVVGYSLEEGVDLVDDLGRFQILVKLSWKYIGDYAIQRKMEEYPEWYLNTTLNATMQTFGRTNRHIDDYSINYVIDTSISKVAQSMDDTTKQRFKDIFWDAVSEDFVNKTFKLTND